MKMQAATVDGFKNIFHTTIRFDRITAIVALNNFGKSNALLAIDFGLDFIKSNTRGKINMMSDSELIPVNKKMIGQNYKFEMEILTTLNGVEYNVIYGYEFSWKVNEDTLPYVVSEYLKIRPEERGQKYTQLISRNRQKAQYKSSETGRCSSKINIGDAELVVNKLQAYDNLFYISLIKGLNDLTFYMEDTLDPRSFYRPNPIIFKDVRDMPLNAESLPRVIYQLQKQDRDKFVLLKNAFQDLFPDIEDINVRRVELNEEHSGRVAEDLPIVWANYIYFLYVKDKNLAAPVNFEIMSDGAKRVFLLLTKIILANESNVSLIAIEEPENSIHPSLFHAFVQIVSQLLDDCKLIITSHSPYIIGYLQPAWIYVGINRRPGIAQFFAFKKSGQKLLQKEADAFKMSTGDYLFSMMADEESDWSDYLEGIDDE